VLNTLSYIGEKLNEGRVIWAVGASMLLNQHGLVDKPNDIDILVDLKDIEKADEIFKNIGEKKEWEKTDDYSTKYFYEYVINGIDVDVMSGLRINYNKGVFEYNFCGRSISEIKKINGVDIPLTSLEEWYVIYQLISGREAKVNMIEKYLLSNGVKKPDLLEGLLKGELPMEVRCSVERLLKLH
jgi:hypothetical protein